MIKKSSLALLFFILLFTNSIFSQSFWNNTSKKSNSSSKTAVFEDNELPKKYSIISLEYNKFKKHLTDLSARGNSRQNIIELPNSKGELKKFSLEETPYLAPKLAAKFPMIKSYTAKGIDNPNTTAKISVGIDGLHAIIFSNNESTLYIDPYTKNKQQYLIYKRSDFKSSKNDFSCEIEEASEERVSPTLHNRNANDGKLRTYRIAIASTGEYSQFHINRQNVPSTASDQEKKAAVLSAMNTTMTRVNGVYEIDLGVRMVIVNDNDKIIFLDAATDDLSNNSSGALINESQVKCDAIIGNANYDIGHTFSTGGGGLAQLRSVCRDGNKARGITGSGAPVNDPYDIDFVAHELGHQFGGTHTFNGTQGNCGGNIGATSVEPGSGTTIMAYAGICGSDNVQSNSDDHFHAVSIAQMWNHVQSVATCGTTTDTGNDAPTANAGEDVSIPKSTPFVLRATATDAQGMGSLTYNWEQLDTESAPVPLVSTTTQGPAFRSLPSNSSPNRYMPKLPTIIAGNTSTTWEVLPSVARELNFALTVRDNHAGGGNTARDDVKITVTDAEAFTVTAPNTAVNWSTGSSQTITWDKGTTDQAPINCAKVNIKLSTDGGLTFPIILKSNIDNDGTEEIAIPNNPTTEARIMVEAADNIFYNVNSTNFTINSTVPTFILTNNTSSQTICNNENTPVTYNLNFDFVNGFSETATLSATGLPGGATATFNPTTISADGDVTMTLNNLNGSNQQDYIIVVQAASATVTQTTDAFLKVKGTNFSNITLTSPTDGDTDVSLVPELKWGEDPNANSYNVVIATDNAFANVILDETSNTNSYIPSTPLTGLTKYFWYVKPKNDCGEGAFSSIYEFTTEAPSYCSSSFTESNNSEFISNVTFNTINNNSGNDHTPNADDGYEDFTSISTNIKKTQEYQISVTLNTAGYQDNAYVFIDWNQDFQFDKTTERYHLGLISDADGDSATTNDDTVNFNITVPNNAVLGSTRMRVLIEYSDPNDGSGDGACSSDHKTGWGETEDYTVIIEEAPQPDFTITNTTGNLSICNEAVNEQTFAIDFKTLFGFNSNTDFSITGVPTNATASFTPAAINANGTVNLNITNLNNAITGDYTMTVTATSATVTKSIDILFNVNDNICNSTGNTASQISTTLVKFGDIDNPSTKTTGYSDFTAKSTEVIKGEVYQLNVNANSDGNNTVVTYAWIDWNQNCLFDAGEQYDLGNVVNANEATSNSDLDITIPNDALTGTTILRVSTKKSDDGNPESCQLGFNGEVEDYTITITPRFTLVNKTEALSICNKAITQVEYTLDYTTFNDFNDTVNLSTTNLPTNATATFSSNSINANGTVTVTITNLDQVANGEYTFNIVGTSASLTKTVDAILGVNDNTCNSRGNNESNISITNVQFGDIDNTSTKTTGYSDFKTISTGVVRGESYDLTTTINTDGNSDVKTYAWVDWNQNCLFDADEAYDLSSNNTITVSDNALLGSTTLRISTKLNVNPNSCELDFNGEVEDYTINIEESFATDATLFNDLMMSPNPFGANERLTIQFKVKDKESTVVRLYDLKGQLLETHPYSTVSSSFNKEIQFSKASSGIYLIQIENAGKISTHKVIVK